MNPPIARRPDLVRDDAGRWWLILAGGERVPVRNSDDLLAAVERGETQTAFAKSADGATAKGMPFTLDRAPFVFQRAAPCLGQHNAEVLGELLGLDAAKIAALVANSVTGTAPKG